MSENLLTLQIRHACSTVPYYKNIAFKNSIDFKNKKGAELLALFPILFKNSFQENEINHLSETYLAKFATGKLHEKRTSGSTGLVLEVIWAPSDELISDKILWDYRQKWYAVTPKEKYISFHTTAYSGNRFSGIPEIIEQAHNLSISKVNKNVSLICPLP